MKRVGPPDHHGMRAHGSIKVGETIFPLVAVRLVRGMTVYVGCLPAGSHADSGFPEVFGEDGQLLFHDPYQRVEIPEHSEGSVTVELPIRSVVVGP